MITRTTRWISTWYDLPGTDARRKWVELKDVKELKKELLHLRGLIKRDVDVPCIFCEGGAAYSEKYDSYYCPKCLYWIERICPDRTCSFCKDKPKYPEKNQK